MAVPGDDLTLMRLRPQWQKWYMAVDKPPILWTARVNGNMARSATDIAFNDADLPGAQEPGADYEVWFGSEAGAKDQGVSRVRWKGNSVAWNVGAGILYIASNDIDLADEDYITIKQTIPPTAILPSIDGVYEDEDKEYTDEGDNQHPLARIGPPACGFLSSDTLTVNFWSDDIAIAAGATVDTWDWNFYDGVPVDSAIAGTVNDPIAVEYTIAGRYWVDHTAQDDQAPDKTHTRYSQVYVFDENNMPITGFKIDSLSGDRDSGSWHLAVTVHEACTESDFPDMCQVVIFTEAYWDGTQEDVGYGWAHRDNIMFVGYIVGDTVHKNDENSSVSFEAIGIVEMMKKITCWGASLKNDNTPTAWHQIAAMNLNLSAFHVLTEHTTIHKIADIYLRLQYDPYEDTPTEITMAFTDLGEASPYDQIRTQIGEAGRAVLLNNKFGQIYLEPNAQLALSGNRPTDEMFTLAATDWRDIIDLGPEKQIYDNCQVDFIGFSYDGTDPLPWGSLAPARQHGTGTVQKVTGVRVEDQTGANAYSGVFEQNYNNQFTDVVLPMAGFWPVLDIAPQRYVNVTLEAADTIRGLIWDAVRHVPKSVTFATSFDGMYCLTDIVVEQEIGSVTGISNEIPTEDPDPDPPDPPDPEEPPVPPPTAYGVIIMNETQMFMSTDFFDVSDPVWTDIHGNLDGTYKDVVVYGHEAYASTYTAASEATTGLWYCSNIFATPPVWELIKSIQTGVTEFDALQAGTPYQDALTGAEKIHYTLGITDGSEIAAILVNSNAGPQGGWYLADSGGITETAILPLDEAAKVHFHRNYEAGAISCGEATFYYSCGTGAGGGGRVFNHAGAAYFTYAGYLAMNLASGGYAVAESLEMRGPGWADVEYDDAVRVQTRVDTISGGVLYGKAYRYLLLNTVTIGDANVTFPGGTAGFAEFHTDNEEIAWLNENKAKIDGGAAGWGNNVVVYTEDAGAGLATWVNKTGDFFDGGARTWATTGPCVLRIFSF